MSLSLEQFGIDRLSRDERIELIGLIEESLAAVDPQGIPESHIRRLEERLAKVERDADPGESWDVVCRRLLEKRS